MTLRDHVRDLYEALPDGASVNLDRSTLGDWLREDVEARGETPTGQKTYTTSEAAEVAGVKPATVAEWCKDGRLSGAWKTGTDGGGEWRVPESDLLALVHGSDNGDRGGDRVRFDL